MRVAKSTLALIYNARTHSGGTLKSICGNCGMIFHSVYGFDQHRTGDYGKPMYAVGGTKTIGHLPPTRRCLNGRELRSKGMVVSDRGWWATGRFQNDLWKKEEV